MAKPMKHNQPWTPADIEQLKQLAKQDTPVLAIAARVGRTLGSVLSIAQREGISLPPRRPYYVRGSRK